MPATHNFHHIVTWKTLPHVHYYFIILRILYMDFPVISDDLYQPLLKKKTRQNLSIFPDKCRPIRPIRRSTRIAGN